MKIVTWNVNGIRAAYRKNALERVFAWNPEVLCLQEIKACPDQLSAEQRHPEGYHAYWNPAERPGYSGVATFARDTPLDIELGLGEARFDLEGRLIRTRHPDFLLYNIYFPSGQRGKERVDFKLDFYARVLKTCDRLHSAGEQIILTGDFNTAHMPIDLKNPTANKNTSGFLPEEREWVTQFLDHGFVDIYRQRYPEREQYTWWTYRANARQRGIGWRLDYFLVSESLVEFIKDVVIHDEVLGSDHCPVELIVDKS
jgi:exodeoxyribonuclease-3